MTDFKTLSGFVEKLQKLSLDPLSLSLVGGEARLVLKSGGAILFPRDRAASLIASDLESFLGSPAIKGEANFWQRLETLDLRTDNKVFYTFRD